jgi:hypothetical protein
VSQKLPGHQGTIKEESMQQRLALFSFLAIVVILLAFTAHH